MATASRQLEKALDRRRHVHDDRLWRPAAAHGHDDDVPVLREQPCDVTGDRRLADPLAGSDHRERRPLEGLEGHRLEAEVRTDVRCSSREGPARKPEALRSVEHRLVGQVDHDLRSRCLEPGVEVVVERHSVVLAALDLLGAAEHDGGDDLVGKLGERGADDVRIVLAVDERERPRPVGAHRRAVTSDSMRAVYFSNSSVSAENWMIRSWPWKG